MKLSVAMIVKDEEANLPIVLDSVKGFADEIVIVDTGSTDATKEIARKYTDKIYDFEWVDDFSKAREFSFQKASHPLVMWIDADDVVVNADKVRGALKAFEDPRVAGIGMIYKYAFDKAGNCITEHWRERIVRKDWFRWEGPIHESLIPNREGKLVKITDIWIKHRKTHEAHEQTAHRNLRILEATLERQKPTVDPRILFGLGQTYRSLARIDESNEAFEKYIELSGWDEEKYIAAYTIGENYLQTKRSEKAKDWYFEAIKILPDRADAYFGLARVAFKQENWDKVIYWTEEGFRKRKPEGMTIYNPRNYDLNPLSFLVYAYFNQGKYKETMAVIDKILEFLPGDEGWQFMYDSCKGYIDQLEVVRCVMFLQKRLQERGEEEKIHLLAQAVPNEVKDLPSLVPYIVRGPEVPKRVSIFCPGTYEFWDPDSLKSGIGGSEEAVIHMSNRLRDCGWNVTVYNMCQEDKEFDGVQWKGLYGCRKEDKPDVFIYWRNVASVDLGFHGHQTYVWLHDLQKPEYWYDERYDRIDKAMVLSKFHRKNVDYIPDEKIWITRNGIDPSQFSQKLDRNPFRCYYASSPDRGLDTLLDSWAKIREAVPQAELDVYYGFTKTFDQLHANNPQMLKWRERIMEQLKQPGVNFHGRVGHFEMAKRILQSQLLLYPTSFGEISFIGGMKAQAGGAVPVCSRYGAVDETVRYGYKLLTSPDVPDMIRPEKQQHFIDKTIHALRSPEEVAQIRGPMVKWALEHYSWATVAKEWSDTFEGRPLCVPQSA